MAERENGSQAPGRPAPAMLQTSVPNLDRVLGGGLLRGSIVMVIGAPGTGKSILALQVAFSLAARGASTLYLTGYSETHDKIIAHGSNLSFFDAAYIGRQIQLQSLTDLFKQGAEETETAIVDGVRRHRATLVVLDGFGAMRRFLRDDQEVAHFLYSLGAKLALMGATLLIAGEGDPDESTRYPELTVCDTIVALRRQRHGTRFRRVLEVVKTRGTAGLDGLHLFTISSNGITILPRFESLVEPAPAPWLDARASLGVPAVDALMEGGLTAGTATLVAGNPGVGKTLLGLHFAVQGARVDEPTLFLGFIEDAVQLREKARAFGLDLAAAEAAGTLRLLILPGYDLEVDAITAMLREDIERRGVRRLVIDSAAEIERSIATLERKEDVLSALMSYLRGRQVTTYITLDLNTIVSPTLELSGLPLSIVAENLLLMRYAEYEGRLHRLFSVLKMRFSGYDGMLHEFSVSTEAGFRLGRPVPASTGLLTGMPQLFGGDPRPRPTDEAGT